MVPFPELIESVYHLYQVTKDPVLLHMGAQIYESIESVAKVPCGYATVSYSVECGRCHGFVWWAFSVGHGATSGLLLFGEDLWLIDVSVTKIK